MGPRALTSPSPIFPGRFPSPTPSYASAPVNSTAPPRVDHQPGSASTTFPQRPLIFETQSERLPPRGQQPQPEGWDHSARISPPRFSPPNRPLPKRRVVSDNSHDRQRNRTIPNHGSPIRRSRHKAYNGSRGSNAGDGEPPGAIAPSHNEDSNSSETSLPSSLAPPRIHEELRSKIRKKVEKMSTSGVVYILRDPLRPHLLKIGSTIDVSQRIPSLERQCGIELHLIYRSDEIENHGRAERLAQADLAHLLRRYECGRCNTNHGEYFEVDDELAKKTVDRWTAFLQQEPYDANGVLKGIWEHLLQTRMPPFSDKGITEQSDRWEHWSIIIAAPSMLDRCKYTVLTVRRHPFWTFLSTFSWQIYSVLSWCITFLAFWDMWAFVCLLIAFGCAGVSMYRRMPEQLQVRPRKARRNS